jgi:hypothetical protein
MNGSMSSVPTVLKRTVAACVDSTQGG